MAADDGVQCVYFCVRERWLRKMLRHLLLDFCRISHLGHATRTQRQFIFLTETNTGEMIKRLLITALFVAMSSAAAPSAELPLPRSKPPIPHFNPPIAGCKIWSDGCVSCTQYGCSNIGFACQPQEIICIRQENEPTEPRGH